MCFENLYFHILLLTKYNLEYTIRIRQENILKTFSIKILISNCHSIEYIICYFIKRNNLFSITNIFHWLLIILNCKKLASVTLWSGSFQQWHEIDMKTFAFDYLGLIVEKTGNVKWFRDAVTSNAIIYVNCSRSH